eukprot:TRINITY_DN3711_c0_g1_i4.p1 TRINITY_DN3711_c0_g1~~TRINITY_DN3711_c0_g1_i4.p1  ORF type:complete len:206 (+),score=34.14 TRINITY_DN3711_c0_g1_i4:100-717(+)
MRLGTFTLAVLCFLIVFGATEELRGLDISIHSGLVPLETFQCLKDSGYDFIIIQVWNGGRQLNKNIKDNVERAWKAGFKYVDLYSFAANNCTNNTPAERPIEEIHEFLTQNNVKYGRLWVDVEPCKGCWLNDLGSNFQYVLRQVVKAQALGIDVHIYSQRFVGTRPSVCSPTPSLANSSCGMLATMEKRTSMMRTITLADGPSHI